MKYLGLIIGASTTSAAGLLQPTTQSSVLATQSTTGSPASVRNANHVFNAIRGAMKQWDSSWNHNGMSFFRATVPEGIQLYHGTHTDKAVMGMEWLAFEPEHAIGFAHSGMRIPPGKRPNLNAEEEVSREGNQWENLDHLQDDDSDFGPPQPPCSDSPFDCHRSSKPPVGKGPDHGKNRRPPPPPPPSRDVSRNRRPPQHPPFPDTSNGRLHYRPSHECPGPDCNGSNGRPPPPPLPGRLRPHRPGIDHDEEIAPPTHALPDNRKQQTMRLDDPVPYPSPPNDDDPNYRQGYLHFYRTLHPLNLLLIDGLSAGKTSRGTLDSQDYALLLGGDLSSVQADRPHFAPFQDNLRAQGMCNMSRDEWDNRIDGFIRMEGGFEIILCNFSAHLELVRAQNVSDTGDGPRRGPGTETSFRFYQAIADRFHGIGGGRVTVDYANMISAFSYDFDLFVNDTVIPGEMLPRLANVKQKDLETLNADITNMVSKPAQKSTFDWQAVAGMVVQHFARPLQHLVSLALSPGDEFVSVLESLLRPMISDGSKDVGERSGRCTEQFVPLNYADTYAGEVVHDITQTICSTLVQTLDKVTPSEVNGVLNDKGQDAISEARDGISQLMSYLAWPIWKECSPSCGPDEVCVIPIWPMTSNIEDRKHPNCKNATQFAGERGPGGPGGPGRRGDKNYWYDGDDDDNGPGGPRDPPSRRSRRE